MDVQADNSVAISAATDADTCTLGFATRLSAGEPDLGENIIESDKYQYAVRVLVYDTPPNVKVNAGPARLT